MPASLNVLQQTKQQWVPRFDEDKDGGLGMYRTHFLKLSSQHYPFPTRILPSWARYEG